MPAAAAWAATALARLPVEAQATVVEAELARLGDRDGDDAVLEGLGRVGGVVLDPEGVEAEPLGQAVGAHQRVRPGSSGSPGRPSKGRKSA